MENLKSMNEWLNFVKKRQYNDIDLDELKNRKESESKMREEKLLKEAKERLPKLIRKINKKFESSDSVTLYDADFLTRSGFNWDLRDMIEDYYEKKGFDHYRSESGFCGYLKISIPR